VYKSFELVASEEKIFKISGNQKLEFPVMAMPCFMPDQD
jgi:hypothetical protein